MIDRAMGNIIIVVAVLEIHMDKKAVASIKPKTNRLGLVPVRTTMCKAIRSCKFHFCIAMAIKNPPANKNIVSSP